ncbi:MAG: hypothetical protein IPK82_19575 [Polyangiaceae bacterium]|nr:hypothetical protein [Polyangiaceae bacterium]
MALLKNTVLAQMGAVTLALAASACGGPSIDGTWHQEQGTTPLPDNICAGCDLNVKATLVADHDAKTFTLNLDMAYTALSDTIDLKGSYEIDGDLTFTIDGFTLPDGSENTTSVAEDGSQCIVLKGFAGTQVCFPTPQTNPFFLEGNVLTVTLDNSIGGADVSPTKLVMTQVE